MTSPVEASRKACFKDSGISDCESIVPCHSLSRLTNCAICSSRTAVSAAKKSSATAPSSRRTIAWRMKALTAGDRGRNCAEMKPKVERRDLLILINAFGRSLDQRLLGREPVSVFLAEFRRLILGWRKPRPGTGTHRLALEETAERGEDGHASFIGPRRGDRQRTFPETRISPTPILRSVPIQFDLASSRG